ncbi:ATP-dependent zinc metalloprotease FtsH [Chloropicon primus]|uniref:ATP-dependent zinc metalloprotease FtsH n=2 Tax=Chloropicon primus TaxID=1764295 RepID=A0A5B8MKC6_9CHLO|nr:ATP-dependent zinc metalloprotease FtsH [Chloropicon primus]|eukprot:QDZ20839.1 ATP-dependent zinc metalloprotease FtsH [Chloropicon primus]
MRLRGRREVSARARGAGHWARPSPLTKSQINELQRLKTRDAEALVEALQNLHPNRIEQLQKALPPWEMRQFVELQLVHRFRGEAEEVASEIQNLVERGASVDSDRFGFWLDMLSDDQLQVLWRSSSGKTREVILDSSLEEAKSRLAFDLGDPSERVDSSKLLARLRERRMGLSQLQSRWQRRYNPALSSDPKDFTLMVGGKRGGKVLPNARFSDYDVRRIKAVGPTLNDVVLQQWDLPAKSASGSAKKVDFDADETRGGRSSGDRKTRDQEIEEFNVNRAYQDERFQFIHPEVVWDTRAFMKTAKWRKMPRMPYMEFFHGLRKRNEASPFYDAGAAPWRVEMYLDGGQRWPRTAFGVRAVVTAADGTQKWVDMPDAGTVEEKTLEGHGYLQVFEQLQQQALEGGAADRADRAGKSSPVSVSYYVTPPTKDVVLGVLQWRWFALGAIVLTSFLGRFFYNLTMKAKAKDRRAGAFEDMNEAIDFGRSRADTRMEGKTGVSLSQVAGIDYLRDELEEVIDLLKDPYKYQALRVRPPKGILLMGPPGVGKTLIAKAIAGEAGVPFYSLAGSEFTELIVGVGAARVRDLFKRARVNVPCLIFIDEIEALGHKREMNDSESKNEERDQALNQLLTEMDGFTPDTGIVVMAATNAPHLIDPALLRPGRFDRKVSVRRPNQEARRAILGVHAQKHPMEEGPGGGVDLGQLASDTPGLSGAELEKVLNEAALEAIRRGEATVRRDSVYCALDRVLEGSSLPPLPDAYASNEVFAYHEAGVALVSELLRLEGGGEASGLQAVKSASLVPRNRSWSRVTYYISSDKSYKMLTGEDLRRQVRVQLAGRAAEELAFGEPTTYSSLDVARASDICVKMLNAGMVGGLEVLPYTFPSDLFTSGIVFSDPQVQVQRQELLDVTSGLEGGRNPNGMCGPSERTRWRCEHEVRSMLEEAHRENLRVLGGEEMRGVLDDLAARLVRDKEVSGDAVREMIQQQRVVGGERW